MEQTSYNETLIEIERGLADLASARTQVETVASKSEAVILALNKILKALDGFASGSDFDRSAIENQLRERFAETDKKLKAFNEGIDQKLSGLQSEQNKIQDGIRTQLDNGITDIANVVAEFGTKVQNESNGINQSVKQFQSRLISQEKSLGVTIESLEKAITASLESLSNLDFLAKITELEVNLNESLSRLKIQIAAETKETVSHLELTVRNNQQSLDGRIEGLGKQIESHRSTLDSLHLDKKMAKLESKTNVLILLTLLLLGTLGTTLGLYLWNT
jgi:hypothetical protein